MDRTEKCLDWECVCFDVWEKVRAKEEIMSAERERVTLSNAQKYSAITNIMMNSPATHHLKNSVRKDSVYINK